MKPENKTTPTATPEPASPVTPRQRSAPYPRVSLKEVEAFARKAFELGARGVSQDRAATSVGYNGTNNGAFRALRAAALYFGAIKYSGEGYLDVTEPWVTALHEEDPIGLNRVREGAMQGPELYRRLIEEYSDKQLPPLERLARALHLNASYGILQDAAEPAARVFMESAAFAGLVDQKGFLRKPGSTTEGGDVATTLASEKTSSTTSAQAKPAATPQAGFGSAPSFEGLDRIEVQLVGGKKAYLFVPTPLPVREKDRLKRYIDLILEPDGDGGGEAA